MATDEFFEQYRGRLVKDADMQALATFAVADAIYHLASVVHEAAYGDRNDMGALARISVMMEKIAGAIDNVAGSVDSFDIDGAATMISMSLDGIAEKEDD